MGKNDLDEGKCTKENEAEKVKRESQMLLLQVGSIGLFDKVNILLES